MTKAIALAVSRGRAYNPTPRVVKITPKLAEEILDKNTLNRPLRSGRVERYSADMKAGNWKLNGESIKITADHQLLDGQHRLFAVIDSGVTIESLIVEGLDADVMATIDTGAQRSFSDVLAIGKGKNTTIAAGATRWVAWYKSGRRGHPNSGNVTHTEMLRVFEANPDLSTAAAAIGSSKARRFVPPSILAFVYLMASRTDTAKAGAWLELLASGANMDEKHPVFQLRERMARNAAEKAKLAPLDVCALAIKSWNQFITGKRTNTLTWRSTEPFPGFDKGGR